jgi:hypothetical protein|tara:strand:+ start:7262 stop:7942 length:681 start_codon:yes stop_codon:yes gene_type:complete
MENIKSGLKIFESKKHVFWQAFFLTLLFFFLGLVLGVYLEQTRIDNTNIAFYQSEASLYDSFAIGKLLDNPFVSCEDLEKASIDFANQIYEEARELERFDDSNKITESLKTIHRKYDLLRTLLWMNVIEIKEKCGGINTVVYLYMYDEENLQVRSKQVVWAKILQDLKDERGDDVILIPIAIDQNIVSLDYLVRTYGAREFPAVVINEKEVLYDHKLVEEFDKYLD